MNIKAIKEKIRGNIYLPVLIMAVLVFSLFPLLHSGYFGDDAANSQIRAYLALDGKSLFEFTKLIIIYWIQAFGRFFPLAWYAYILFASVPSLVIYKTLILLFVCLDVLGFGYLIKLLTGSKPAAFLGMLIMPALFQYRLYDDPILAYHFLLQIVTLYIVGSLALFLTYLKTRRKIYGWLSLALYGLALLTYEITYVFFIFYFLMAYVHDRKFEKTLKTAGPYLALAGAAVLLSFYLRSALKTIGGGYSIHFGIVPYFSTLLKQTAAGLPLFYYFSDPSHLFSPAALVKNITAGDVLLSGLMGYLFWTIVRKMQGYSNYYALLLLGASLGILPAVLISLSAKHQTMALGLAYLPVYIQYFGMAFFFLGLYGWLYGLLKHEEYRKWINLALGALLVGVNLLNLQNNRIVVERTNQLMHYPRLILGEALQNGLLDTVPENAVILTDQQNPWDTKYFYYLAGHKKVNVIYAKDYFKKISETRRLKGLGLIAAAKQNIFVLKYRAFADDQGYVFLGKLDTLCFNSGDFSAVQSNVGELRLFKVDPRDRYNCAIGKMAPANGAGSAFETRVMPLGLNFLTDSKNAFELFAIPLNSMSVEFGSVNLSHRENIGSSDFEWVANDSRPLRSQCLLAAVRRSLVHVRFTNNKLVYDFVTGAYVGENNAPLAAGINGKAAEFDGSSHNYIQINPLDLEKTFSLELVLYLGQNAPWSAVIGNHPGWNNHEGFVLERDETPDSESYILGFGDGTAWQRAPENNGFKLSPQQWHYLAITREGNHIKIYDNGRLAAEGNRPENNVKPSGMPVIIGNWIGHDRPFHGLVEEVLMSGNAKSAWEIAGTWQKIKEKLVRRVD